MIAFLQKSATIGLIREETHMNAAVLVAGTVEPLPARFTLSADEMCNIAILALEYRGRAIMDTMHEIDRANSAELNARSIKGSVLEPIVDALCGEHDQPVSYTYGSVRDALALSDVAMHVAFCSCENGASMRCDEAALQLRGAVELERAGKLKPPPLPPVD